MKERKLYIETLIGITKDDSFSVKQVVTNRYVKKTLKKCIKAFFKGSKIDEYIIKEIDITNTTPMQALNLLYELKNDINTK